MQGFPARLLAISESCPQDMLQRDYWTINDFVQVREIGSGAASTVYYSFCRKSCMPVALKMYKKSKLSVLNRRQVEREINIHSSLRHPHIVDFYAAFEDDENVYLVQEYAAGGDLFDEVKRRGGRLPEHEVVSTILYPYMCALMYIHGKGVIHRDIKPENTVFTKDGVMKITDFGLAINGQEERPVTRLGTLDYMAPEVLRCPDKHLPNENKERADLTYGASVDDWAIGVLAYELVVGRPPFGMSCRESTMRAIHASQPVFPDWMSAGARDFIELALQKICNRRSCIRQLMEHPWILQGTRSKDLFQSPFATVPTRVLDDGIETAATAGFASIGLGDTLVLACPDPTAYAPPPKTGFKRAPVHRCNSDVIPVDTHNNSQVEAKVHITAYWHTDGEHFGEQPLLHHAMSVNQLPVHWSTDIEAGSNPSLSECYSMPQGPVEPCSDLPVSPSSPNYKAESMEELKQLWMAGKEGLRGLYNKVVSRSFNIKRRPDDRKTLVLERQGSVDACTAPWPGDSEAELTRSGPPSPSTRHAKAKRVNPLQLDLLHTSASEPVDAYVSTHTNPSSPESQLSTGTATLLGGFLETAASINSLLPSPSSTATPLYSPVSHSNSSTDIAPSWRTISTAVMEKCPPQHPAGVPPRTAVPAAPKSRSFTLPAFVSHSTIVPNSPGITRYPGVPVPGPGPLNFKHLLLNCSHQPAASLPSPLGLRSSKNSHSFSHSSSEGSDETNLMYETVPLATTDIMATRCL